MAPAVLPTPRGRGQHLDGGTDVAKASNAPLGSGDGRGDTPPRGSALPIEQRTRVLAPSDFAFLWDECPRCFYNKVVLNRGRPRSPFPNVFGAIDRAMKLFFLGGRAEGLADD